jgi:hypothetical protein
VDRPQFAKIVQAAESQKSQASQKRTKNAVLLAM